MDLYRGVIFAILMQTQDGILSKAPPYIEEKLYECEHDPYPEHLLDKQNTALLKSWIRLWLEKVRKEEADV